MIHWSGDIATLDLAAYRWSASANLDDVVVGAASVHGLWARGHGVEGAVIATHSVNTASSIHASDRTQPSPEAGVLGDGRAMFESIGVPVMEPEVFADAIVAAAATLPLDGPCAPTPRGCAFARRCLGLNGIQVVLECPGDLTMGCFDADALLQIEQLRKARDQQLQCRQ